MPLRASHRTLGYRGAQVLSYVQSTIADEGQAPSYSMICNELGIGTKADVARVVARLERRGLLRRTGRGKVRRIALPQ